MKSVCNLRSVENTKQDSEDAALKNLQRFKNLQLVFIALFTSILAFFLLVISIIEIESQPKKRYLQKINLALYMEMSEIKKREALDWLEIENTVAKGIKLSFDPQLFQNDQLFFSARARVNPEFVPYVNQLVGLLNQVNLPEFESRFAHLVSKVREPDERFSFMIRVEGHTDATPLAKTALYRTNIELSSYRAYAIMELIRLYTKLPQSQFSVAGYGSFRPLVENPDSPLNRRVEIYIHPQLRKEIQTDGDDTAS